MSFSRTPKMVRFDCPRSLVVVSTWEQEVRLFAEYCRTVLGEDAADSDILIWAVENSLKNDKEFQRWKAENPSVPPPSAMPVKGKRGRKAAVTQTEDHTTP